MSDAEDATPRCPNCSYQSDRQYYDPHWICDNPNCRVAMFEGRNDG